MRWSTFCIDADPFPFVLRHRHQRFMGFVYHAYGLRVGASALLLLGVLVGPVPAMAQAPPGDAYEDVLRRVEQAIDGGQERVLIAQAADRIEIALLGAAMLYSGAQAEFVLRSFFRDHPPARFAFTEVHRTPERLFAVGQYTSTQDERPMKVYVRFQRRGPRWEVQGLRIDRRGP